MYIDFSINSVLGSVTIAPKYFFFFYGIGFYVFVLACYSAQSQSWGCTRLVFWSQRSVQFTNIFSFGGQGQRFTNGRIVSGFSIVFSTIASYEQKLYKGNYSFLKSYSDVQTVITGLINMILFKGTCWNICTIMNF